MKHSWHHEAHFSNRNNWLRASVLGANDGLISTASLLMGMAATAPSTHVLLLTSIAALVSGAASMAAGEYVSVSSQSDTETADLRQEKYMLDTYPESELEELIGIYQHRGLSLPLAQQVARALTQHDALNTHARDEIGITDTAKPKPVQAALASALSFSCGALLPVLVVLLATNQWLMTTLSLVTLFGLSMLGWLSARLGGAPAKPAIIRILILGTLALAVTTGIGHLMKTF